MKALVQIAFAIEVINEDGLLEMAKAIDESMRVSIAEHFSPEKAADVTDLENKDLIDWYGATITVKKPVFAEEVLGE